MSVLRGDCVEVMAGMEPDSVDAIVCDPPYGLEFMGKEWDRLWDGREARAKAETFVGSDGATRRKTTGFSAHTASPTYQAGAPAQRWHEEWGRAAIRVAKPGAYLLAFGGTRTVHRMTCALEDAGWVIRDMLVWAYAQGFPKSRASLKPAWEPIVLARKPGPLRDLNIDAARIPMDASEPWAKGVTFYNASGFQPGSPPTRGDIEAKANPAGRWPANVILTDPILDGGWDSVVGGGETGPGAWTQASSIYGTPMERESGTTRTEPKGTASRYFYIPKAPTRERVLSDGRRSPHPTQKPEALIRHLVTLVTPPGGLVLDPFLGSGTLGVVCEGLGVRWVGIEREAEYADWAEDRIADGRPQWMAAG